MKTIRLWIRPHTYRARTLAGLRLLSGRPALRLHDGACPPAPWTEVNDDRGNKHKALSFRRWGTELEPLANLSRPEKSYVLLAPLARGSGGLALCQKTVFAGNNDPLYREILAAIRRAQNQLNQGKRFDMPGFHPNEHYVREMKRFGFLPEDLGPQDPVNAYAVDRAYWDSFNAKGD